MGRATSGVIGMRFRAGDELLAMDVVRDGGSALLTVTDGGFAKRTRLDGWTPKGRGGLGVIAMRIVEDRGSLVGAVVVERGRRGHGDHGRRRRHPDPDHRGLAAIHERGTRWVCA